jgi:hypothetical protein
LLGVTRTGRGGPGTRGISTRPFFSRPKDNEKSRARPNLLIVMGLVTVGRNRPDGGPRPATLGQSLWPRAVSVSSARSGTESPRRCGASSLQYRRGGAQHGGATTPEDLPIEMPTEVMRTTSAAGTPSTTLRDGAVPAD